MRELAFLVKTLPSHVFPTREAIQLERLRRLRYQYPESNSDNVLVMSSAGSPARLATENDGLLSGVPSRSRGPWARCLSNAYRATKATLCCSYANLLLVFVPLGIIGAALDWNPTAVFIFNFLAIFPLAAILTYSTEELSAKVGQTVGGLINATFGNAVEMIVSPLCIVSQYWWLTWMCFVRSASLP